MLSKQAFEYYRSEYKHYQAENATDEKVLRFGEDQGVSDLPSFDGKNTTVDSDSTIHFRRNKNPANGYYPTSINETSPSSQDYSQQKNDSYLEPITQPRTIVGNASDEMIPLVQQKDGDSSSQTTNMLQVITENGGGAVRPPPFTTKRDDSGDSYA